MSKLFGLIRQHLMGAGAPSRNVAKERLSVMLVHQRNVQILSDVDMESLQKELTAVVQKYIKVSEGERPVHYSGMSLSLFIDVIIFLCPLAYFSRLFYVVKQEGGLDLLEIHFPIDSQGNTRVKVAAASTPN
jgi:cell division topological specificity factor MinE